MSRIWIALGLSLVLAIAGCGKKKDCDAYAKRVANLPSSLGPPRNADSSYEILLSACKDGSVSDKEFDCAMSVSTSEALFECLAKK